MEPRTLEALKASIAKWERNVEADRAEHVLISSEDCPLCMLFYDEDCVGCPVMQATGALCCGKTPYATASAALSRWSHGVGPHEDYRAAAQAEVDFLKSLLPTESTPPHPSISE
jgi:hypothetical protein